MSILLLYGHNVTAQIQLLLKLNFFYNIICIGGVKSSNTTLVKVKLFPLTTGFFTYSCSNTTLVKIK